MKTIRKLEQIMVKIFDLLAIFTENNNRFQQNTMLWKPRGSWYDTSEEKDDNPDCRGGRQTGHKGGIQVRSPRQQAERQQQAAAARRGEANMERQTVIKDLSREIETLARLHIQHGLHRTKGFANQKRSIERLIRDNDVNLKKELDPLTRQLYHRYFE